MATEEGIVTRSGNTTAWIKTTKSDACKACSARNSCHTLGGGEEMEVEAINHLGAQVGQKVVLSFDTTPLLKATFMIYVLPILILIVGAFIGQQIAVSFHFNKSLWAAIIGFLFFGLTILFVRSKGNKMAQREEYQPKIIRIIGQE